MTCTTLCSRRRKQGNKNPENEDKISNKEEEDEKKKIEVKMLEN